MPQPGYGHLLYAVAMLARQARLSLFAKAQLNYSKPDYSKPDYTQTVSPVVSADTSEVSTVQPDSETHYELALNALEAIAARFGAAGEEIGIAHGRVWDNDLLDLIAKTLRIKKARMEKWNNIIVAAGSRTGGDEGFVSVKDCPAPDSGGTAWQAEAGAYTGEWFSDRLDESWLDDDYRMGWVWEGDPLAVSFVGDVVGIRDTSW